jgi:glycosyltransferase involved in cell wall biosynthesis
MPTELRFVLPGDPDTRTGGYIYDKRICAGLRDLGWNVRLHCLDAGFPNPDMAALELVETELSGIPTGAIVVIDGLALGGMPEVVHRHRDRLALVGLIHHPLAAETGLDGDDRERLLHAERAALGSVRRVIVPSVNTAMALVDGYGIDGTRIEVVEPGTDRAPLARGSGGPGVALLCVGSVTPRKGYCLLLEALSGLRRLDWRLICVGNLDCSPETVAAVQRIIRGKNLEGRVELVGEVTHEQLGDYYHRADVFVLASYLEGYGMVLAEALARGLPIVSTTGGAIPEVVPGQAARLVPPGGVTALREALAEVITDSGLRERLAIGAREAREKLPSWPRACERFAAALAKAATP